MDEKPERGLFKRFFQKKTSLQSENSKVSERVERDELLRKAQSFNRLTVADVMVPRADIIAVECRSHLPEIADTFKKASHSRLPIYDETLDSPIGMVHIKDILSFLILASEQGLAPDPAMASEKEKTEKKTLKVKEKTVAVKSAYERQEEGNKTRETGKKGSETNQKTLEFSSSSLLESIKRPLLYIPSSMRALDLLMRMKARRIHMALVVDEFGGTDGLVTLEDLVEQIVGDIEDEHDKSEEPQLYLIRQNLWYAEARVSLETFEGATGFSLKSGEEEIDTLGGIVPALTGRVPERGEVILHPSGCEFEIIEADSRRIKSLHIHLPEDIDTGEVDSE